MEDLCGAEMDESLSWAMWCSMMSAAGAGLVSVVSFYQVGGMPRLQGGETSVLKTSRWMVYIQGWSAR